MILADAYEAFLLDLDGVVWRGETPVPGADEAIRALRERERRVVFVTNNSSRTPREYAVKLARMKIPTATEDIVTSGHVVVEHLKDIGVEPGDRVHVCGGEGLVRLLAQARFVPTTDADPSVRAVVVGWNPRGTFEDLRRAADLVRRGVPFVASNADPTYPAEGGSLLPGTGAIVAAVEVASGRPCTVVGKPRPDLFRLALRRAGVPAQRALVVGDRPATDVVGARAAGLACALVLTGVTSERDLGSLEAVPDELLDSLGDLLLDLPCPRVERRTEELVAVDGGELARVGLSRSGATTVLRDLRVPPHLPAEAAWRVVRRLLVEALAGGGPVRATPELLPWLERLGADAQPAAPA